jgi:hypothetical protein
VKRRRWRASRCRPKPPPSWPTSAEISKRVDIYATALFHNMTVDALSELDLSYTPPLGSPLSSHDGAQRGILVGFNEHQPAQHVEQVQQFGGVGGAPVVAVDLP